MRRRFLAWCAALLAAPRALAQRAGAESGAPVVYRGVYASINLRPAEEMVRRLSAQYGTDRRVAIREVLGRPSLYMPPVLYALANTLAEDQPEQAIFWYHVGRLRAVYDALRCRDKSAQEGLLALRRQVGTELARSQFYRRERLLGIATKAIDWDAGNARDYDHRWIALHGKVARASPGTDASEVTVPESEWPALLKRVHETHLKSVQVFAAQPAPTR